MQEIAQGVYIDTSYVGVTLGAISLAHGLVLVDAPLRAEDVRSWRSALLNLGGGIDRLLVTLDAHYDRTLGVRAMECTVIAHEKVAQVFRNRPTTFKPLSQETGADWEQCNGLSSVRWAPPEITFSQRMFIHWGEHPIILEHRPGPSTGAIWLTYPEARVVFVGDAVTPNQPPFLAYADLPAWIETLHALLTRDYADMLIVSGRGGLTPVDGVRKQIAFLEKVRDRLTQLAEQGSPPEAAQNLAPALLKSFQIPAEKETQYANRLRYGLYHYYARNYHPTSQEPEE